MKKRRRWIVVLVIVALVIVGRFNREEEEEGLYNRTIIATIVDYYDKDDKTIIVLDSSGFTEYVSLPSNTHSDTMYADDEIEDIIENRETGAKVIAYSEYRDSEVFDEKEPPWIYPLTFIEVDKRK